MRKTLLNLFVLAWCSGCGVSLSESAPADEEAKKILSCATPYSIDGWIGVGTHEKLQFNAEVVSNSTLKDAVIAGAFVSDKRDLKAKENYRPTNPRYNMMNRFGDLEDAWNWFYVLLPKNIDELETDRTFIGYVQIVGEEGGASTAKFVCRIKNGDFS